MTLNEMVEKAGGIGPSVVLVAVCLNAGLSALSLILDKIKDLTPSDADNKAAEFVKGLVSGVQKVIDFLSANVKH
jgi:hypothetical protein